MNERLIHEATVKILNLIKKSQRDGDQNLLGRSFLLLTLAVPENWFTLLSLEKIILDPDNMNFVMVIEAILTSYKGACSEANVNIDSQIVFFLNSIMDLGKTFKSITHRLENLGLWQKPGIQLIIRVASFVEDQYYLMTKNIATEVDQKGYYEPLSMILSDSLPTEFDDRRASYLGGYETNCENLQLILAYCLWKFGSDYSGVIECINSPYNDEDFRKLLGLAHIWRNYKYLWEKIKYQGWLVHQDPDDLDLRLFYPPDYDVFIREQIGSIRFQRIKAELGLLAAERIKEVGFSDTDEVIRKLSGSIKVPEIHEIWDGELNLNDLNECIQSTPDSLMGNILLDSFYYKEFLDLVVIGSKDHCISWTTYRKTINVIRILSKIFQRAVIEQVKTEENDHSLRGVLLVSKNDLVKILTSAIEDDENVCRIAIELLIFDPSNRHIEIWDTPLLPVDEKTVLFVPSIVMNGGDDRTTENFIAQWNEDLFKKRGKLLEQHLLEYFKTNGIPTEGSIRLARDGNIIGEYDLVLWWQNYLFLIEAKCTKSIFGGFDAYRAQQHVNEAIDQLITNRQNLLDYWDIFRNSVRHLKLPSSPPGLEKIKLVAVTNVMEFTGQEYGDVVVTDDFCLRRFFQPPEIEKYIGGLRVETIGRIRKSDQPTPEEFIDYLMKPPQVIIIKDGINTKFIPLQIIYESDAKFGYLHSTYTFKELPSYPI